MERFVGSSGNPKESQSSEEVDNPNRPMSLQPEPYSVDSLTKIRDSSDPMEIPIGKKKMPETSLLKANEMSKPQNRVSYPRLERLELPVTPKWVRFAPDVEDSKAQNRFKDGGQQSKEREEVLEDFKDQNRFGDDQEIEKREVESSGSDDDKEEEDDSENVVNPDPNSGFVMIKKNDQSESETKEKSNERDNWPCSLSTEIQTEFEIVGSHVMTKDIEGKVPVVFGVNFPAITQEKEQESSSSTTSESSEETVESEDNNPLNEDDASWNDSGFDSWNSSETKTSSSMTTNGQDIGVKFDAEADIDLISPSPTSEDTSESKSNEIVAEPSVEMNKESDSLFTPKASRSDSRLTIVNSDYNLRATPERIRFAARYPDYPASQRRLSYNLDLADKMSKYA